MRKALIGLLIAATAMTPLASAAAAPRGRDGHRAERNDRQVRTDRQVHRAQRQEQRADRVERRTDRRLQRAERSGNPARVVHAQRQERRADRVEQRTDRRLQTAERTQQARNWNGNRNSNWADRYRDRGNDRRWDNDRNRGGSWNRNDRNRGSWNHGDRREHNWSRNWRNDRRYNWQHYRNSHRNIYRAGRYWAPYRNYRYSRFSIGFFMDPLFYSSHYWIADPWYYRLPPAYPGTRWVRYYDDVLLVDTYTGEVIDVIYDFFW